MDREKMRDMTMAEVIELIEKQEAEIERLKAENERLREHCKFGRCACPDCEGCDPTFPAQD